MRPYQPSRAIRSHYLSEYNDLPQSDRPPHHSLDLIRRREDHEVGGVGGVVIDGLFRFRELRSV